MRRWVDLATLASCGLGFTMAAVGCDNGLPRKGSGNPEDNLEVVGPELVVSDADGQPFFRIATVTCLPSAGYVVTSRSNPSAVILDSAGSFLRRLGGAGRGPGEFIGINGVSLAAPDTLFLFDTTLRRLTTYSLTGSLVGITPLAAPPPTVEFAGYRLGGVLADGNIVVVPDAIPARPRPEFGVFVDSAPVLFYDRAGKLSRSGPFWRMEMYSGEQGATRRPMGFVSAVAVGRSSVILGEDNKPRITVYDRSGDVRNISWQGETPALSKQDRNRYIQERLVRARNQRERDRAISWYQSLSWPDRLPYFGQGLLFDEQSKVLLIQDSKQDPQVHWWRRLTTDGRELGLIPFPHAFRPHAICGKRVAGVWTDADGAEELRVYTVGGIDIDQRSNQ